MNALQSTPSIRINDSDLAPRQALQALAALGRLLPALAKKATDDFLVETARNEGLQVSDEELQKAADGIRTGSGLNKAEDAERWLAKRKLSKDELESVLERALLRQKLIERVAGEHVGACFAQCCNEFDRLRLSRIVVGGKELAEKLKRQIHQEGSDFADLMRRHSTDAVGREIGSAEVTRAQLPPAMKEAVIAAQAGDVVGPIQHGDAWHVIKVEEVVPGELTDVIRRQIREALFQYWLHNQIRPTSSPTG